MKILTQKQLDTNYAEIKRPTADFFCRRQSMLLTNYLLTAWCAIEDGDTNQALDFLEGALSMLGVDVPERGLYASTTPQEDKANE